MSIKTIYFIIISIFSLMSLNSLAFAKESNSLKLSGINLYNLDQRKDSFDECADVFPQNTPELTIQPTYINPLKWGLRRLCSNDFAVLYSDTTKTPLLVVEKLNGSSLKNANIQRSDDFFADPRTPSKHRAVLADYKGVSNIDRGHLAPAADAVSIIGMSQTFALSNIVPQDSNNNRNAWKKIESDVRKYVLRSEGDVYIITGVLFEDKEKSKKIGKNQIWKPSHLFKVVYHPHQNKSWAYVIRNKPDQAIHQISYQQFQQQTGVKFGFLESAFKATSSTSTSILPSIKEKIQTICMNLLYKILSWMKDNDKI